MPSTGGTPPTTFWFSAGVASIPRMPRPSVAIVWFRRDLRVHDHPALHHALERYDRLLPLFVVDDGILTGRWQSANRRWFLAGALASLDAQLRERDSALTLARGDPRTLVAAIAASVGAATIVVSRDYTPYGRARDADSLCRLPRFYVPGLWSLFFSAKTSHDFTCLRRNGQKQARHISPA